MITLSRFVLPQDFFQRFIAVQLFLMQNTGFMVGFFFLNWFQSPESQIMLLTSLYYPCTDHKGGWTCKVSFCYFPWAKSKSFQHKRDRGFLTCTSWIMYIKCLYTYVYMYMYMYNDTHSGKVRAIIVFFVICHEEHFTSLKSLNEDSAEGKEEPQISTVQ